MMRAIEMLPLEFERFRRIGGVLTFAVYEDAGEGEAEALAAIAAALPDLDKGALQSLGCRRIDKRTFFGDWYDAQTDAVLRIGEFTTRDGQKFVNPRLKDLAGKDIWLASGPLPEAGSGGQFAYAFSCTPFALNASAGEVQQLFNAITNFVLPPTLQHHILDWSGSRLPEASKFFAAGMEWWGVFLFTVYVPSIRRLTVIAGSTSD
jgi:hypothetical protein